MKELIKTESKVHDIWGSIRKALSNNRVLEILLVLPAFCMVLLTLIRLFYGAGMGDEAFYLAMPKAMLTGMRPFADMWEIHQTSAFFLVPFMYIYRLITGGFEGIFLFSRLIWFVFTLFVATVGYHGIKKYINKTVSIYVSLILVTFAPFSIYHASYNNLAYSFLLLGLFLLMNALSIDVGDDIDKKQKRKKMLLFTAGVSHALLGFFYPTSFFLIAFLGLFVIPRMIYLTTGYKGLIKTCAYYVCGGIIAGIFLICTVLIAAGGISNFISGINGVLANPMYGGSTPLVNTAILSNMPSYVIGAINRQRLELLIYIIILLLFVMFKLKKRVPAVYALLTFIPFATLVYVWYILRERNWLTQIDIAFLAGGLLPVGLYFMSSENKEKFVKLFTLFYLPSFVGFLVVCISSYDTYIHAPLMMIGGIILAAIFIVLLLEETLKGHIKLILQITTCILFCFSNLFVHYNYVYQDALLSELTYKVESGVYRGIRTTESRGVLLENTEEIIKSIDQEGKTMMAMDMAPYIYLMSDMRPSVPNLTSATYYHIGKRNCSQLIKYFSTGERHPDFVFFINPAGSSYGEDPAYGVHTWLRKSFVLTHDFTDTPYVIPFWVFERLHDQNHQHISDVIREYISERVSNIDSASLSANIVGQIESITNVGDNIHISGWFAEAGANTFDQNIFINITSETGSNVTYNTLRTTRHDVVNLFDDINLLRSGFIAVIPSEEIEGWGDSIITVIIENDNIFLEKEIEDEFFF